MIFSLFFLSVYSLVTVNWFEEWGNWGDCSTTCLEGIRSRTRECKTLQGFRPVTTDPSDCAGDASQTDSCSMSECCPWSEWGTCSTDCGEGTQTRTEECISGTTTESQSCTADCSSSETTQPVATASNCFSCTDSCLSLLDTSQQFTETIPEYLNSINWENLGLLMDLASGGRRRELLLIGGSALNCNAPCAQGVFDQEVCGADGVTYTCSLSAFCYGQWSFSNGKCDVGLGGTCRHYDLFESAWVDGTCASGLTCEPYLDADLQTFLPEYSQDLLQNANLNGLVDLIPAITELESASSHVGDGVDIYELMRSVNATIPQEVNNLISILPGNFFTDDTQLRIIAAIIETFSQTLLDNAGGSLIDLDDILSEYSTAIPGLDVLLSNPNLDLSSAAEGILTGFTDGLISEDGDGLQVMYTCQSQSDTTVAGANEICAVGTEQQTFWSMPCADEGYECMLMTVDTSFSWIYTCQNPNVETLILGQGDSCQYVFESIPRRCGDGLICAPTVTLLAGIQSVCVDTEQALEELQVFLPDTEQILADIMPDGTSQEDFEEMLNACSLSCFQECDMDLELCIDSMTKIFDTFALPLQVEALACDQLASIIPCDQSVDIGGLDFALSTICCDACKDQDLGAIDVCVDKLAVLPNVAETCESIATTVGCGRSITVGGVTFGLSDVCCATCADYESEFDSCIDTDTLLPTDISCSLLTSVSSCDQSIDLAGFSLSISDVCCATCESGEVVDSCVDHLQELPGVTESCNALATTIGCDHMMNAAGLTVALSDFCCETCTDFSGDIELDTCVDTESLLPTDVTCSLLTSFTPCEQGIDLGGFSLAIEDVCCATCESGTEVDSCVDHLQELPGVTESCNTLAATIGCDQFIMAAGVKVTLSDFCCETCSDFSGEIDTCVDSVGLLPEASECDVLAAVFGCDNGIDLGGFSLTLGDICCDTCAKGGDQCLNTEACQELTSIMPCDNSVSIPGFDFDFDLMGICCSACAEQDTAIVLDTCVDSYETLSGATSVCSELDCSQFVDFAGFEVSVLDVCCETCRSEEDESPDQSNGGESVISAIRSTIEMAEMLFDLGHSELGEDLIGRTKDLMESMENTLEL